MIVTCTATFHQGDERHEWIGVDINYVNAFVSAATRQEMAGLLPSGRNRESAVALLRLYVIGSLQLTDKWQEEGYAHIRRGDNDEPEVSIGWVTYRFTRTVRLWAVTAQVSVLTGAGWDSSRQVPTFYLDPQVQGITDRDHAARIAEDILFTSAGDAQGVTIAVHVEPVY